MKREISYERELNILYKDSNIIIYDLVSKKVSFNYKIESVILHVFYVYFTCILHAWKINRKFQKNETKIISKTVKHSQSTLKVYFKRKTWVMKRLFLQT